MRNGYRFLLGNLILRIWLGWSCCCSSIRIFITLLSLHFLLLFLHGQFLRFVLRWNYYTIVHLILSIRIDHFFLFIHWLLSSWSTSLLKFWRNGIIIPFIVRFNWPSSLVGCSWISPLYSHTKPSRIQYTRITHREHREEDPFWRIPSYLVDRDRMDHLFSSHRRMRSLSFASEAAANLTFWMR